MEKKESKIKSNVAAGMSSTAGAAVGVVAGSAVSQSAFAAEEPQSVPEPELDPQPGPTAPNRNPGPAAQPSNSTPGPSQPSPEQPSPTSPTPDNPTPTVPDPPKPEPPTPSVPDDPDPVPPASEPTPEPEVEVVSYETVTNNDGSQMDVAVLDIDGTTTIVLDGDRDGIADVIAVDENHNSMLEEEEVYPAVCVDENGDGVVQDHEVHEVAEMQIEMQPFREAYASDTDDLAYEDIEPDAPDYINNADVDGFMA